MGVPNASQDQLRDVCCYLANVIEDIDKAAVCCAGCHYELSDTVSRFSKLLHGPCFILICYGVALNDTLVHSRVGLNI